MANFSNSERKLLQLLASDVTFNFDGKRYRVLFSDKPKTSKGEPKTDIYACCEADDGTSLELKISYKQENADFIENKTSAIRAESLFGSGWESIIKDATRSIETEFHNKKLIFKSKYRRTQKGSMTLGWKYELLNKSGGELSARIHLTKDQVIDIYAGINLPQDKKNAEVCGNIIKDSGVANYILMADNMKTTQELVDALIPITEYVEQHPNIYFACKALNYRSFDDKWDGDRPLAVQVDWNQDNGKIKAELNFDAPLTRKGNELASNLKQTLADLGISNTDDIDESNVFDEKIINE